MPVERSGPGASFIRGDRPSHFDPAAQGAGAESASRAGGAEARAGGGAPPPATLSEVIKEAARRSGLAEANGQFTKADVVAINNEIRKDPVLAAAFAQARSDRGRRKGKLQDIENAPEFEENRRGRGSEDAEAGVLSGANLAGALLRDAQGAGSASPEFCVEEVSNHLADQDLTAGMLRTYDLDGDGIIAVRELLQFLLFHSGQGYRFNDAEFARIIKIATEGVNAYLNLEIKRDAPSY